jgi:aryl-alcohol dehydrogenase-like predicted oxidoreductase
MPSDSSGGERQMLTRRLGRTGFMVTELGLGTWPLAGEGPVVNYGAVEERHALGVLHTYVDRGGIFIDTARAYNNAEALVGRFLRGGGVRERIVLSSKTVAGEQAGTIPRIRDDLETSLRALGTDHVEVYFLHHPPEDPGLMARALDAMETLKREGKIRAIGASIKGPNVTEATERLADAYLGTGRVDVLQVVYSVLRQRNRSLIEKAKARDVGVVVRTALESGLLTGAYRPGHVFTGNDHRARYDRAKLDHVLRTAEELRQFAVRPPYRTLPQVALRFSLDPEGVSCLIFGAQSPAEVVENLDVLALPPLDPGVVAEIRDRYGALTEQANFF